LESIDPNARALRLALQMCFEPDPDERPNSSQVAALLNNALTLIQGPNALKNVRWPFDEPPVTRKDKIK